MNRTGRRLLVTAMAAGAAVTMTPTAANATIHEIVAQYCSGHDELEPRGVSTPGKKSFARPVLANGVVTMVVDGTHTTILVDEDHPALKVDVLGYTTFPVPGGTLTVPILEPSADFPAFQNCRGLNP